MIEGGDASTGKLGVTASDSHQYSDRSWIVVDIICTFLRQYSSENYGPKVLMYATFHLVVRMTTSAM